MTTTVALAAVKWLWKADYRGASGFRADPTLAFNSASLAWVTKIFIIFYYLSASIVHDMWYSIHHFLRVLKWCAAICQLAKKTIRLPCLYNRFLLIYYIYTLNFFLLVFAIVLFFKSNTLKKNIRSFGREFLLTSCLVSARHFRKWLGDLSRTMRVPTDTTAVTFQVPPPPSLTAPVSYITACRLHFLSLTVVWAIARFASFTFTSPNINPIRLKSLEDIWYF